MLRKVLTVEMYSQYARKNSRICLNRGREESVGNDDVFYCSRPQVKDGQDDVKQKIPKGPLRFPASRKPLR